MTKHTAPTGNLKPDKDIWDQLFGWAFILFLISLPLAEVPRLHMPGVPFLTLNKLVFVPLVVVWGINRLLKGLEWPSCTHFLVLGCFFLSVLISLLVSYHRLSSIQALLRLFGMGLLFIIALEIFSKPIWLGKAYNVLVYEFGLLSLLSLIQVSRGKPFFDLGVAIDQGYSSEFILLKYGIARSGSTFDNPNHFGLYLAIFIVVGSSIYLLRPQKQPRKLILISYSFILSALFFTFSITAIISLAIAITISVGIKKLANWKWLWLSTVFLLSLVVLLRFSGTDPSTTDQFVSYSQERLEADRVAARLINDHPFFGCGLNSYRFLSGYYKNPILFFKSISPEVHNTFLQVWAELGLMGLLSFLGLFGLGLRNLFHSATRQRTPYDKPLLGATIVIAVFCLLHPILYWEVLWLTLAAVIAHQSKESTPRRRGFRNLDKQEIIPKGR